MHTCAEILDSGYGAGTLTKQGPAVSKDGLTDQGCCQAGLMFFQAAAAASTQTQHSYIIHLQPTHLSGTLLSGAVLGYPGHVNPSLLIVADVHH